ncbi:MAG: LD-carboxypeptidase [Bdellovibrio sp.]|nr:LD-carboxypeptidase [Bdellovibrio sp.]
MAQSVKTRKMQVGILAPSFKVGQVELKLGVEALKKAGFEVRTHPQCKKAHLFFAGTDEERANAFYEYAIDPTLPVLWAARGGYGAIRLIPILDHLSRTRGVPPTDKLLISYSDGTVLNEYVRKNWGWATLHAPSPAYRKFSILEEQDWKALQGWIRKEEVKAPWSGRKLQFWGEKPGRTLEGTLVGGNLTVWTSLLGTSYEPEAKGKILFFEDVDESLYRIDRMLQQLFLSGSLHGVRAIVLGTFLNCKDVVSSVLKKEPRKQGVLVSPRPGDLKPIRKKIEDLVLLRVLFSELGKRLGVPVAFGLPVGHGPEVSPLPLGAQYRLHPDGRFELVRWNWINP